MKTDEGSHYNNDKYESITCVQCAVTSHLTGLNTITLLVCGGIPYNGGGGVYFHVR